MNVPAVLFSFIYNGDSTDGKIQPFTWDMWITKSSVELQSGVLYDAVTVEIYDETIIVNGSLTKERKLPVMLVEYTVTGWSHNGGTNFTMYHVNRDISSLHFRSTSSTVHIMQDSASYIKNTFFIFTNV